MLVPILPGASKIRHLATRADLRSAASPRDTLARVTLPMAAAPPQALRAIHMDRRLASCSVSLPQSFSPLGWNGECISRPRLRRSWRTATDPYASKRDSLPGPPLAAMRADNAAAATASGAAPSAPLSTSGASVSRPISRVQCRVCSPLSTPGLPILLSAQRVECLPFRLARTRRNPGRDRSWTPISGLRQSMSRRPLRTALARRLPTRDTGRAAAGGPVPSRSTLERTIQFKLGRLRPPHLATCGLRVRQSIVFKLTLHWQSVQSRTSEKCQCQRLPSQCPAAPSRCPNLNWADSETFKFWSGESPVVADVTPARLL